MISYQFKPLHLLMAIALVATLGTGAFSPQIAFAACPTTLTLILLEDPFLLVDSNNPASGPHVTTAYATIKNTGVATAYNVYMYIGNGITPGTFNAGSDGNRLAMLSSSYFATRFVGDLVPGASKTVYWMLTYPLTYGQTYPLTIWANNAAGCSVQVSHTYTTQSAVSAESDKILGTVTMDPPNGIVSVGNILTVTVNGFNLGTIGTYGSTWFQPVGNIEFNPAYVRLVRTEVYIHSIANKCGYGSMPYIDRLYFPGIRTCYSYDPTDYVKYYFVGLQAGTNIMKVYQEAASGSIIKYSSDYGVAAATLNVASLGGSVTLVKSVSPLSGGANTLFTWTIKYINNTNNPLGDPQTGNGLVLTDAAIPVNTTYVAGSATCSGSCIIYYSTDNGATWTTTEPPASNVTMIKWYINQAVPAYGSGNVSFQSRVNSGVPGKPLICNTASCQIDNGASLAEASVCANGGVDLALNKVVNQATPCEGSNITYTIRVTNLGPGNATNIQVTDLLPTGLTYYSSVPSLGSYNSSTGLWTVGNVSEGANATLLITATVNIGTGGQTITNTGNITHVDQTDSVITNNSAYAYILVLSRPVAVADSNTPVCLNGTIQLYGGPSGMSYSWTGPLGFNSTLQRPTIGNATLAMAGNYTLTVTNTNGCSDTKTIYVTVQTCITTPYTPSNLSPGNATCVGLPVTLIASNFTDPGIGESHNASHWQIRASTGGYSYPVFDSGTAVNGTSIDITPGILSTSSSYYWHVMYQDNFGAWSEYSNETCFYTRPVATANSTTPVCEGGTIQLTGGPSGMTYSWIGPDGFTSDAQSVSRLDATLSMAGNYTLTVTDTNGCSSNATTNVVVNARPVAVSDSNTPICVGGTIQLYSGPSGMSYSWTGPLGFNSTLQRPTIGNATLAMAGNYTLIVTNTNGCSDTKTIYVTVQTCITTPYTPSNLSPGNATCVGLPVTLIASNFTDPGIGESHNASHWQIRASTGGYSYPVFDSGIDTGNLTSIVIPDGILSDSSSYYWHVMYQDNLTAWSEYSNETCFYTKPVAIASSNSPVCHKTAIQLFGGPDGMDSYHWVGPPGSGFDEYGQNQVILPDESGYLDPELAGNYTLTVTDANGCSDNVTITVDMNLECECPPAQPSNLSPGNESCVQLPVQLVSSEFMAAEEPEGTPDDWLEGTEWQVRELGQDYATPVYDLVTGNVTNITVPLGTLNPATTYYWHVKHQDNEGAWSIYSNETCFYTNPVATANSTTPVCEGGTIELTGGPSGMSTYSWVGPDGFTSSAQSVIRFGATLSMAGNYTLTVTDSNGCSASNATNVVVNAKPVATASSNSPVFVGATIHLYGGPDGMTTYNWTGPNSFSSSSQNVTIDNATLGMTGVYTLTVTNGNGCSDVAYAYVQVDISPPVAPSNVSPGNVTCVDLPVTLTASAFSSPEPGDTHVASQWQITTSSGTYLSPVFDSGTDIGNLASIVIPDGILSTSSSYYWHVRYYGSIGGWSEYSNETCFYTKPVAVADSNTPVCVNETIQLYGGPSDMTYNWTGPNGFNSTLQRPTIGNATLEMAGNYTLTVTNTNGCSDNTTIYVEVVTCATPPYTPINLSPGNATCVDLPVILIASNFSDPGEGESHNASHWQIRSSTGGYSYPVFDSGTDMGNLTSINITAGILSDSSIYYWHVRYQGSLGAWSEYSSETCFYTKPVATASLDFSVCEEGTIELTGGPSNMSTYSWTGPDGFTSGAQSVSRLDATISMAGNYTLTVTDANGCSSNATVNVVVNAEPACHISASPGAEVCAGNNITLMEDGGDAVSWEWTTAETTSNITVSTSGTYGVTITGGNGCTSYCEIEVTIYELPTCHISASPGTTVCEGDNVTLTEDGGDAVSWEWTTAETTSNITVSTSGTYGVTITDGNGCTSYCEVEVTVYELPACHISASPGAEVCAGNNITLMEDGGDAVSWEWTTAETTSNISISTSGTYGVTITGGNGCTSYCEIEVTIYESPTCHISASPGTEVCEGDNVTLTEDGGDAISWEWTTAETTSNITVSTSGTYGVTITDGNGCTSYCEMEITVNEASTWYQDNDGDTYGNATVSQQACSQPDGYVLDNTDCNDNDAKEHPGQIWYKDADNDGYSDSTNETSCTRPTGYKLASELIATSGDCDDNNAAVNPGAVEVCNGIDDNCDGNIDECTSNISGTIRVNGIPLPGVLVTAHSPWTCTATTDIDGKYELAGVPCGETDIHITPTLAGYTFNPPIIILTGPITDSIDHQDFVAMLVNKCDECGPESPCPAPIPEQCPTETAGGGLLWSLLSTTYIMGKAVGDVTENLAGTLGCYIDELAVPTFGTIAVIMGGMGGMISGLGDLLNMEDIFNPIGEMFTAIGNRIMDALPS